MFVFVAYELRAKQAISNFLELQQKKMLGLAYASNFEMTFIFRKIDITYEWQKTLIYTKRNPPDSFVGF